MPDADTSRDGTERIGYECKRCREAFVGDRWEPDYPGTECPEHEDGQHVWAEESDSYV